jgi:hypothetical protein
LHKETIYRGIRDRRGCHVEVVSTGGHVEALQHLNHHHPGLSYQWGSGRHPRTADLSLSILADAIAANTKGTNMTGIYSRAMRLSIPFEWVLRSSVGWMDNWEITRREVLDWVHDHEPMVSKVA